MQFTCTYLQVSLSSPRVIVPATTPVAAPQPGPNDPDCGTHGDFNGRACVCDAGYTQTGLAEGRTCEAIPPCQGTDDGYEPNDIPAKAVDLATVSGSLFACPADADWFVFPVTAGDLVTVELRFDGALVDLDLLLYGPSSRSPRALSLDIVGNSERAAFVARTDGTAGIYVQPYGLGEGAYELLVDVRPGEAPTCAAPGAFCTSAPDCCSGICHVGHCH